MKLLLLILLPLVLCFTKCLCDSDNVSQINEFLNELRITNPADNAGLVPYQEKSMKHLTQWLRSMKNYKLSQKCGTVSKRKESLTKNNEKKSLMKIINCSGDGTKRNDIEKFYVTSYDKNEGLLHVHTKVGPFGRWSQYFLQ